MNRVHAGELILTRRQSGENINATFMGLGRVNESGGAVRQLRFRFGNHTSALVWRASHWLPFSTAGAHGRGPEASLLSSLGRQGKKLLSAHSSYRLASALWTVADGRLVDQ